MWFASIWISPLRLPWRAGADFFYRQSAGGDAASNTLGCVGGGPAHARNPIRRRRTLRIYRRAVFSPRAGPLIWRKSTQGLEATEPMAYLAVAALAYM